MRSIATVTTPPERVALTTLERVKAELAITGDTSDELLVAKILEASSDIEAQCRRGFGTRGLTERVWGEPGYAEFGDVDTAVLVLRFASGARATFSFSRRTAYGFDETLEVFGAKGMLQSLRHRERSVALWQGPHVSESGIHGGWYDRFAPTYVAALAAFFDAVRGGTAMSPDLTDGLRAQAVAEAARESIATGKPVAIETSWN